MLVNNRESVIDRAHKIAAYVSSAVHGLAPILAAILPLLPYTIFPENKAFFVLIFVGLACLFVVGALIGRIAKFNLIMSGFRMLLAGLATILAGLATILIVMILSPSHFISMSFHIFSLARICEVYRMYNFAI